MWTFVWSSTWCRGRRRSAHSWSSPVAWGSAGGPPPPPRPPPPGCPWRPCTRAGNCSSYFCRTLLWGDSFTAGPKVGVNVIYFIFMTSWSVPRSESKLDVLFSVFHCAKFHNIWLFWWTFYRCLFLTPALFFPMCCVERWARADGSQ